MTTTNLTFDKQSIQWYQTNAQMFIYQYDGDERLNNIIVSCNWDGLDQDDKEEVKSDFNRICDMDSELITDYIDRNPELGVTYYIS